MHHPRKPRRLATRGLVGRQRWTFFRSARKPSSATPVRGRFESCWRTAAGADPDARGPRTWDGWRSLLPFTVTWGVVYAAGLGRPRRPDSDGAAAVPRGRSGMSHAPSQLDASRGAKSRCSSTKTRGTTKGAMSAARTLSARNSRRRGVGRHRKPDRRLARRRRSTGAGSRPAETRRWTDSTTLLGTRWDPMQPRSRNKPHRIWLSPAWQRNRRL